MVLGLKIPETGGGKSRCACWGLDRCRCWRCSASATAPASSVTKYCICSEVSLLQGARQLAWHWGALRQHQHNVATAARCLNIVFGHLQAGSGLDMALGRMSSSCDRVGAGLARGELLAAVMHHLMLSRQLHTNHQAKLPECSDTSWLQAEFR